MDTPDTFAAALLAAAAQSSVEARAVVQKGALNIKNEAKRNVATSAPIHNAHAAGAITYDTHPVKPSAEIGYDKAKRGGSLGNILEYGTSKQAGHRDLGLAADHEEPRFEQAISLLAAKLL